METAIATWADRLIIPEVQIDISKLAGLIEEDRRSPGGYSMVVMSEGANLGLTLPDVGEADAYGHRKKANVAEFLADDTSKKATHRMLLPFGCGHDGGNRCACGRQRRHYPS